MVRPGLVRFPTIASWASQRGNGVGNLADGKTIVSAAVMPWSGCGTRLQERRPRSSVPILPKSWCRVSGDNRYVMAWMEVPGTVFKLFQKWDLSTGEQIRHPCLSWTMGRPEEPRPVQAWGGDSAEWRIMPMRRVFGHPCRRPGPKAPRKRKGMGSSLRSDAWKGAEATLTLSYVDTGRKVARSYSSAENFLRSIGPVLGGVRPARSTGRLGILFWPQAGEDAGKKGLSFHSESRASTARATRR